MNRTVYGLVGVAVSLLAATTISAGGWAVVTVETLPEYVRARRRFTLEYTVRQHGVRLLNGLRGSVEARGGSQTVNADARPGARPGSYVATLTIPEPGRWSVTIQSGFGGHGTLALQPLNVIDGTALPAPLVPSERGHHLFVAKGCATCHRIAGRPVAGPGGVGPELVPGKFQANYLASILSNPGLLADSPRSPFRMPNLGLERDEIQALVAFLSGN